LGVADSVVWLWLRRPGLHSFLKNGASFNGMRRNLQTHVLAIFGTLICLRYHRCIGFLND